MSASKCASCLRGKAFADLGRIRKGSATCREGSSTYGIISLREPVKVALAEAKMIQQLGATVETGVEFGRDIQLAEFAREL